MMRVGPLIAAAAVALLLMTRRAGASVVSDPSANLPPGESWDAPERMSEFEFDLPDDTGFIPWSVEYATDFNSMFSGSLFPSDTGAGMTPEIVAFLRLIRDTETGQLPDPERYFVTYGYRRFSNAADHPVRNKQYPTGEYTGVPLSDAMCRKAGLPPGCVSTAAGAYQFIRPTWENLRRAGNWGPRLPDFSPASQDEAARRLLGQLGIPARLKAGDIEGAIAAAGRQWASLPGSTAGQNPVAMGRALSLYRNALASLPGPYIG